MAWIRETPVRAIRHGRTAPYVALHLKRPPSVDPGPSRYRGDVDGLRAVAVLAVVAYHAGLFTGGFVGVDVFFVISGFLITGLLWREVHRSGRVSFAAFYARRARRLLPAAMVVLVVTVIASVVVLSPLAARDVAKDAESAALYVANFRFASLRLDYLNASRPPSPLQHYWSLAVEEQFYLVWPLLILATVLGLQWWRRCTTRAAATVLGLVGLASLALSVRLTDVSQPWAFFSLPSRAWEFVAGGLVALSLPALARLSKVVAAALAWSGMALIAWAVVTFDGSTAFPGLAAMVPVAGAAAVIAAGAVAPRRGASLLLGRPGPRRIGRISYAWYLWHWPVLILAAAAAGHALPVWQNLLLVAFSGLLARVTLELVENPVRFAPLLAARPWRSLAGGLALTATATAVALVAGATLPSLRGSRPVTALTASVSSVRDGAPRPAAHAASGTVPVPSGTPPPTFAPYITAAARSVAASVDTMDVPSNLDPSLEAAARSEARPFLDGCDGGYTDSAIHPCVYGDKQSSTTVVLLGDSHAAQWYPALSSVAKARDWRVVSLTKAVCPPLVLTVWSPVLARPFRECAAWRASALDYIRRVQPAAVVLGVARHYGREYRFQVYGPEWISGLAQMVTQIRDLGVQVAVVGPVAHPKGDVPDCLAGHLNDVVACTQPLADAIYPDGVAAESRAVMAAGGAYLDVSPWMCASTACAVIVGNLLVFRDDNHVTVPFATWLAPVFAAVLDPLVPPPTAAAPGRAPAG